LGRKNTTYPNNPLEVERKDSKGAFPSSVWQNIKDRGKANTDREKNRIKAPGREKIRGLELSAPPYNHGEGDKVSDEWGGETGEKNVFSKTCPRWRGGGGNFGNAKGEKENSKRKSKANGPKGGGERKVTTKWSVHIITNSGRNRSPGRRRRKTGSSRPTRRTRTGTKVKTIETKEGS